MSSVPVVRGGVFSYPGGDARMARHILRLVPPHKTFCEPFVGGGAVTWAHPGGVRFVVGDADPMVIAIWQDIKTGRLREKLSRTTCVLGSHKNLEAINALGNKRTPLQNLAIWRMSLMGRIDSTITPDEKYAKDGFCFTKLKRNADKMYEKAQHIEIRSGDWEKTVQFCDSKSTFFYLDPPWAGHSVSKCYNKTEFSPQGMFEFLRGIQGKFLMYHHFKQDVADMARDFDFYTYQVGKRFKRGKGNDLDSRKVGNGDIKGGYLFVSNYNIPLSQWKAPT